MDGMPDFVRKAIEAQGKIAPETVIERMEAAELEMPEPMEEAAPEERHEQTSLGISTPPADAP